MSKINEALTPIVKYFRPKSAHSDDFLLSAVHYKLVFGALLISCILSGLTAWYAPIGCLKPESSNIQMSVINQWCYANSTFIVKSSHNSRVFGIQNSYAQDVVYLNYYQWVTLALIAQATCFQIPRVLWKSFEGGRVKKMVDFAKGLELMPERDRVDQLNILANYLLEPVRRKNNRSYFTYFAMCQIFYFVNIVAQIFFTHTFLNHQFLMLVPKWFFNVQELDRVFPKQAKCSFWSHGPSGDLRNEDVLCVLALNVLIEKIYFLMWVLLLVAFFAALIQCICLIAIFSSSKLARYLTKDGESTDKSSYNLGESLLLKFFRESVDCVTYLEFKHLTDVKLKILPT